MLFTCQYCFFDEFSFSLTVAEEVDVVWQDQSVMSTNCEAISFADSADGRRAQSWFLKRFFHYYTIFIIYLCEHFYATPLCWDVFFLKQTVFYWSWENSLLCVWRRLKKKKEKRNCNTYHEVSVSRFEFTPEESSVLNLGANWKSFMEQNADFFKTALFKVFCKLLFCKILTFCLWRIVLLLELLFVAKVILVIKGAYSG